MLLLMLLLMLAPQAKNFSKKRTRNPHHHLFVAENHQNREIDSIHLARGLKFKKKNKKRGENRLKNNLSTSFFLKFGPWTLKSSKFDRKFGFYEKFPPQNRLEMSRI